MNEKENFERPIVYDKVQIRAVPFVWIVSIIVAAIMFFATGKKWMWTFDFILGAATSMFGFSLMVRAANRTKPEYLKKAMTINYFIRFIMYGIVIGFVYFTDGPIGLIPLAIGLTIVKIVIFMFVLITSGRRHD